MHESRRKVTMARERNAASLAQRGTTRLSCLDRRATGLSGRVDSDQKDSRGDKLNSAVHSWRPRRRRQLALAVLMRDDRRHRLEHCHRGRIPGGRRQPLRYCVVVDRYRDVGATAWTRLLGLIPAIAVPTPFLVVPMLVTSTSIDDLVRVIATGARRMEELNPAVAVWSGADDQGARYAGTLHQHDRPDQHLANATRQVVA